mmetsp:Transcript_17902/g.26841  ORF Transcript_17902/g.26841 Transcript_17902/m.26841 type:complete len:112 (+) Transcript_17902:2-337(+)
MLVWNANDPVLSTYKVPGCSHCTLYQHTLHVLRRHALAEKPEPPVPIEFQGNLLTSAERIIWPPVGRQAEMQMISWSSATPTHSWPNGQWLPGSFDSTELVWEFFQHVMRT